MLELATAQGVKPEATKESAAKGTASLFDSRYVLLEECFGMSTAYIKASGRLEVPSVHEIDPAVRRGHLSRVTRPKEPVQRIPSS